jgi:hypothetical protein
VASPFISGFIPKAGEILKCTRGEPIFSNQHNFCCEVDAATPAAPSPPSGSRTGCGGSPITCDVNYGGSPATLTCLNTDGTALASSQATCTGASPFAPCMTASITGYMDISCNPSLNEYPNQGRLCCMPV